MADIQSAASHAPVAHDHAALIAACAPGVALCTIVGIEGSFSRRLGAQLAVLPDGSVIGSLSDGCLERQLATDVRDASGPVTRRYGQGGDAIDFRLPCGGGLDILIDPAPDREACRLAVAALRDRRPATVTLADNPLLAQRPYIPALQLLAFGEGPELDALATIAQASGIAIETADKDALSLGTAPDRPPPDLWSAVLLLFHDHEWERALLHWALEGEAFYIGAQGGEPTRLRRATGLLADGLGEDQVARVRGPIGAIAGSREPVALALSVLAEIVGQYERLHDR